MGKCQVPGGDYLWPKWACKWRRECWNGAERMNETDWRIERRTEGGSRRLVRDASPARTTRCRFTRSKSANSEDPFTIRDNHDVGMDRVAFGDGPLANGGQGLPLRATERAVNTPIVISDPFTTVEGAKIILVVFGRISITLLCRINDFRWEFCSAARTAPDPAYQPRLHRVQNLFPRNTGSFF